MANTRRVYQVAEKIRNVVATELLHAADPRFSLVTITSVVVSPDLRIAKVYWVVSGDEEKRRDIQEAFERFGGLLKRTVGKELGTRFIPELKFFYDDTLDTAEEVERLFSRIKPSSPQDDNG